MCAFYARKRLVFAVTANRAFRLWQVSSESRKGMRDKCKHWHLSSIAAPPVKVGNKQGNQSAVCETGAALVSRLSLVLRPCSGYVIVDVTKRHDLAGEFRFWLKMFNFSVDKASFAAGQALKSFK